jgi:hypothetical protein
MELEMLVVDEAASCHLSVESFEVDNREAHSFNRRVSIIVDLISFSI